MRTQRRVSSLDILREQAVERRLLDFAAMRRARQELETFLLYRDWKNVGAAGAPGWQNGWGAPNYAPRYNPSTGTVIPWEVYHTETRNPLGFFRDRWGYIHLRGRAAKAVKDTAAIFTLPSDLVPEQPVTLETNYKTEATGIFAGVIIMATCRIRIQTDGQVKVLNYYYPTYPEALWVSFDDLQFRAANVGELKP